MPESEPFSFNIDLSWAEDENGVLTVSGCASVPKEDREKELVTKEAIEKALPDFMELPVLHLNHTEEPIGLITKAWFEGDEFHIFSPIKMTRDCEDVRKDIRSGLLSQFSIFGRRIRGSSSCSIRPEHRSDTCYTYELFLKSVSICPKGDAMNPDSYVEHNGGIVVKSMNSDSALIHETADGVKENTKMEDNTASPEPSDNSQLLQKILETVTGIDDRLTALEGTVQEMTHYEPEEGIEKAEDEEFPDEEGGAEEEDPGPDIQETLSTLAQGMEIILDRLDSLEGKSGGEEVEKAELEDYPDDGYEDEEPGPEGEDDEEDEVEKGCSRIQKAAVSAPDEIKKAQAQIDSLNAKIEGLIKENDLIRKSVLELEQTSPRDRKVRIVPDKTDEIKKAGGTPAEPTGDNPAALMAGQFGG